MAHHARYCYLLNINIVTHDKTQTNRFTSFSPSRSLFFFDSQTSPYIYIPVIIKYTFTNVTVPFALLCFACFLHFSCVCLNEISRVPRLWQSHILVPPADPPPSYPHLCTRWELIIHLDTVSALASFLSIFSHAVIKNWFVPPKRLIDNTPSPPPPPVVPAPHDPLLQP